MESASLAEATPTLDTSLREKKEKEKEDDIEKRDLEIDITLTIKDDGLLHILVSDKAARRGWILKWLYRLY